MNSFTFREYVSTQRVISPVTTARWTAMCAGEEWLGYVQYQLAMTAARETFGHTKNDAAAIAAGQLYTKMVELPTPDMPSSEPYGQQAWNAARALFAQASGITEDTADTQLREDFGYYIKLVSNYFDNRYAFCADNGRQTSQWLYQLLVFTSVECGVNTDALMSMLDSRHDKHCPHHNK